MPKKTSLERAAFLNEWYQRIKAQARAARSSRGDADVARVEYRRYKHLLVCAQCGEERTSYLLLMPTEQRPLEPVRKLIERGRTLSQVRIELQLRTVLCIICKQAQVETKV